VTIPRSPGASRRDRQDTIVVSGRTVDQLEVALAMGSSISASSRPDLSRRRPCPHPVERLGHGPHLNQANKLSRTWATLLEALNRHRGKGQQKVTVEHVHVHAGGQAVVGTVEAAGGGKPEEQAHAKQIAHAPEPALRSPDAARHAVPVARDGERPLPGARRNLNRCTEV
jgi:hypothetical protein